jgi:phosphate transport system substrate-binding protein
VIALAASQAAAQDVLGTTGIRGAGSTFVYPLLSRWSIQYRDTTSGSGDYPVPNSGLEDPPANTALEYEPVGSLAGILRVKDRSVDFAASEMPLRSAELDEFGLAQFPLVTGGIAVATNVEGIGAGELKLTGPLLADVYLGKVKNWSDPAIRALNPNLKLPDAQIVPFFRSDGSGTTYTLTDYLSKVSPEWRRAIGSGLLVSWPAGQGAKGNEGIALAVKRTRNAIAYVEYSHAKALGLADAQIRNRSGAFVRPDSRGIQAAAAGADWTRSRDFSVVPTDVGGEQSYPITATVFVLLPKSGNQARRRATLDFFRWSLDDGARTASRLGYVPLPPSLASEVRSLWAGLLKN